MGAPPDLLSSQDAYPLSISLAETASLSSQVQTDSNKDGRKKEVYFRSAMVPRLLKVSILFRGGSPCDKVPLTTTAGLPSSHHATFRDRIRI